MLANHLTFVIEAQEPTDLRRLAEHLPYEWVTRAVQATGAASIRRRRLPAEQVVWLVIALAMYRHWSISEVLDSLDLALPNEAAPFVSKSAVVQARQRVAVRADGTGVDDSGRGSPCVQGIKSLGDGRHHVARTRQCGQP
jgi:hypothetical protein